MEVTLLDIMGNDLTVVNAARVSFDKESQYEWIEKFDGSQEAILHEEPYHVLDLKESDKKLIKFLAKHNHWSPFSHATVTFRVSAPIFVARQLVKHQVGLSWNEVSRRYVDTKIENFQPTLWRARHENKKQGSSDTAIKNNASVDDLYMRHIVDSISLYQKMLEEGVCPEQARMVLPQSTYTSWYWTGSLYAFARIYNLRTTSDAQYETRIIAQKIGEELKTLFPYCWEALTCQSCSTEELP